MSDSKWAQTIADLKRELACIESSSQGATKCFEILQREAEFLKVEFLKYSLEEQRKAVARQRGFASLIRDKDMKKMGISVAVAAVASIIGGLTSKDKWVALNEGRLGLKGTLQGFGETMCVVSLQNKLVVVPYDTIPWKGTWVTLDSLIAAIHELKREVLQGKRLGTLDDIIQRLRTSKGKLIYIALLISNSTE
jgi:hypothetical protein